MRFVGRVTIILIVAFGAAVAHSMVWPITRDIEDARARAQARGIIEPGLPEQGSDAASDPERSESNGGDELPGGEPGTPDPVPVPVEPPDTAGDLPDYYISVARAYELWEEGMPFVDARTDAEREVGTIEGAFHLETRHFISGMSAQVLNQLEPAFPVIVFCGGGECDASENVAQRLIGRGYAEVYIMHDGFGAWEAAGHPTEPVGGG
ncbi:MAG: rhodanese-like domain-containing protein [Phycisphaera sp.]|nr:MAG: rhodanese-like domain-containing protein [Phycisphaera sp.]